MTTSIVIGLLLALAIVLAVTCAALGELFRQVETIRAIVHLEDQPIPLDIRANSITLDRLGLPAHLDKVPELVVLFLSNKCSTCRSVAAAFEGGAPQSVWFVVEGSGEGATSISEALSASSGRVVHDEDGSISKDIGLTITPSVVTFRYGEAFKGYGIGSARQALSMIPTTLSIGEVLTGPPPRRAVPDAGRA
jgi:hypothetical protein